MIPANVSAIDLLSAIERLPELGRAHQGVTEQQDM
jgi:hypothetical protein